MQMMTFRGGVAETPIGVEHISSLDWLGFFSWDMLCNAFSLVVRPGYLDYIIVIINKCDLNSISRRRR